MSVSTKRPPRKPNWTEAEKKFMLDLYAQHREVLSCTETSENCQEKADCWASITEQMNRVSTVVERSVFEVKRKWYFLIWQGRKDFMKWKAAQKDMRKPRVTVSPMSIKAVELRWNIKFEEWKDVGDGLPSRLKYSELIPVDASYAERYGIPLMSEQIRSILSEVEKPRKMRKKAKKKRSKKKRSKKSLVSVDEVDGLSALAVVRPLPHLSNLTFEGGTAAGTISTNSEGPTPQTCTPQTVGQEGSTPPIKSNCISPVSPMLNSASDIQLQHGVWSINPVTSMYKNCLSTASGESISTNDIQVKRDLETIAASASLNQISLESLHQPPPITIATIHPSSSSSIQQSSLLASSTTQTQESSSPPPEEPARKKFRGSETVQSTREAELRMDILQLEKDKLWLETEKLRLEIDILRKQKQQMDSNF